MKNFIEELTWRGMLHDLTPGAEEHLLKAPRAAYVGIDPTADSLHIGHLVSVMILKHFQACGHRPIVLIGGATGMIGDPSGKSQERNLLTKEQIETNIDGIKAQLSSLLNFDDGASNCARLVNNHDWIAPYSFIGFIRDIGKHITVNYMMAKDSVKRRFDTSSGAQGLSFTEFSYQLIQATDFLHLHRDYNVTLQLGGSDQWGNITTGIELVRRIDGAQVYGLTCPLITKSDGRKFGKTEQGNVWLDPERTSPYQFYQFWLNTTDEEAERYVKIYTMLDESTVESLVAQHHAEPHRRILQNALANAVTEMVHGREELEKAIAASAILFGKNTHDALLRLDERTFLAVFEGVPTHDVAASSFENGIDVITLLTELTQVFPSKGELRRAVQGGGVSINKTRVEAADEMVTPSNAIDGKYILAQRGKKEYHIIRLVK